MQVIGLTGNIACGKSSISNVLREFGAYIIDADIVAREVMGKGRQAWSEVKEQFGKGYISEDGEIDREKLGNLVFSDAKALNKLNEIVHPIIVQTIEKRLHALREEKRYKVVVIDAALLIETKCDRIVDEIWVVTLPYDIQLKRLIERDNLTGEQARRRIQSQMPQERKIQYADEIIDNSKDLKNTRQQVENLWNRLKDQPC